jgi:osmotically-inducible protein OsmY
VRRVKGVHGIADEIEVRYSSDEKMSDDEIARRAINVLRKIEAALKRHAEIEARDIRVTVRADDEVLLEGKVRHWDEKFAVENAARSASGVKNVKHRLTIGS